MRKRGPHTQCREQPKTIDTSPRKPEPEKGVNPQISLGLAPLGGGPSWVDRGRRGTTYL